MRRQYKALSPVGKQDMVAGGFTVCLTYICSRDYRRSSGLRVAGGVDKAYPREDSWSASDEQGGIAQAASVSPPHGSCSRSTTHAAAFDGRMRRRRTTQSSLHKLVSYRPVVQWTWVLCVPSVFGGKCLATHCFLLWLPGASVFFLPAVSVSHPCRPRPGPS